MYKTLYTTRSDGLSRLIVAMLLAVLYIFLNGAQCRIERTRVWLASIAAIPLR